MKPKTTIGFSKYDAAGNDFVMIYDPERRLTDHYRDITIRLSHRHHGIGADGCIFINAAADNDFSMVYINANGDGPAMCGNGARAAVQFYYKQSGEVKSICSFVASDGVHHANVENIRENDRRVAVTIKSPDSAKTISWEKGTGTLVDTGVPHLILETDPRQQIDVDKTGRDLRHKFDANVNFIFNRNGEWFVRTFERGVEAETLSCGTGATAVAWNLNRTGKVNYPVDLHFEGGILTLNLEDNMLWLSGPVREVFSGIVEMNIER